MTDLASKLAAAPIRRIRGDWLADGVINNMNRQRVLEVAIVNGRAYRADMLGEVPAKYVHELAIDLTGGELRISPGVAFLPDAGELARVGLTETKGA